MGAALQRYLLEALYLLTQIKDESKSVERKLEFGLEVQKMLQNIESEVSDEIVARLRSQVAALQTLLVGSQKAERLASGSFGAKFAQSLLVANSFLIVAFTL